jgi:hypothetical protein
LDSLSSATTTSGKKGTEAGLDLGFALLEQADRDLTTDIGVYGVISGGFPTPHAPVADLSIDLTTPGRAYDRLGQLRGQDELNVTLLGTLGHGLLLVILLKPGEPPGVIDWECAGFGDPAYDLAVVTRGVRRPFQVERGLDRLMAAYCEAGGTEVCIEHVRLHELVLAAYWYREALDNGGNGRERPVDALARIHRVFELASH